MDAELIYLSLIGELGTPLRGVENAFAPGSVCEMLYQKIYNAKCSLFQRLDQDEDPDVECIMDGFWEINRELCLRMYRLGTEHTAGDPQPR